MWAATAAEQVRGAAAMVAVSRGWGRSVPAVAG